jgi:hypothetical protein
MPNQPRHYRIEVDEEIAEALLAAGFPVRFMRLDPLPNDNPTTRQPLLLHFNHHAHRAALAQAEADE